MSFHPGQDEVMHRVCVFGAVGKTGRIRMIVSEGKEMKKCRAMFPWREAKLAYTGYVGKVIESIFARHVRATRALEKHLPAEE